jgi:benzoylformate decarboxylase
VKVEPAKPLKAAFVCQAIAELRKPADIVVEEAPTARTPMQAYLPITRSGGFFTMDSGGLGWGMPAAVGVALARPGERVIAIIGDGSAMYSIQALWSAVQLKLPIAFVILNNRRYAALRDFATVFGFTDDDEVPGTELPAIDFVSLAKGHGCEAVRVSDADALRDALHRAAMATGPTLIEVEIA